MRRPNAPSTGSPSADSTRAAAASTNQSSETATGAESPDPTVRWYEPGDVDGFLSLYETVWGTRKGPAWFDWRFRDNPAASDVEMVVAEADGQLVGAEPLLPYHLRVGDGDRRLEARQPVDWIVHPEYRRMGIFSAMTERLLVGSSERADLLFNFPNEALRPGIEDRGWRMVDTVGARYRVQDLHAALEMGSSVTDGAVSAGAAHVGSPLLRAGLGLLDRVHSSSATVSVTRAPGVSTGPISSLYAESVPERIHAPRTRAFVEWRFANPRWNVETYVAARDGDAVATGIVASESIDGHDLVRLLDVQPMAVGAIDADAFEAMLRSIVSTHDDAAVIKLSADLAPGICRRYGFVRDDRFPFAPLSATTYHAVRPLAGDPFDEFEAVASSSTDSGVGGGPPWSARLVAVGGSYDLAGPDDWLLSPGDMDVG